MEAIAYGGAGFVDWRLLDNGKIIESFETKGINPFFHDERYISGLLNKVNPLVLNAENIQQVHYFGAGVTVAHRKKIVHDAFVEFFKYAQCNISHDLHAAAIACSYDEPAIVGTIGSSSNATYFDGKQAIENNFGLGYLLADEGSANWLGRVLLKDWLYENIPADFNKLLQERYEMERNSILDKVYKYAHPEQFLCSFVDILAANRSHSYVQQIVRTGFSKFLSLYIVPLSQKNANTPIHFVGTVAATFQDYLREEAAKKGLMVSTIIKDPIYSLVNYFIHKNSTNESRN